MSRRGAFRVMMKSIYENILQLILVSDIPSIDYLFTQPIGLESSRNKLIEICLVRLSDLMWI